MGGIAKTLGKVAPVVGIFNPAIGAAMGAMGAQSEARDAQKKQDQALQQQQDIAGRDLAFFQERFTPLWEELVSGAKNDGGWMNPFGGQPGAALWNQGITGLERDANASVARGVADARSRGLGPGSGTELSSTLAARIAEGIGRGNLRNDLLARRIGSENDRSDVRFNRMQSLLQPLMAMRSGGLGVMGGLGGAYASDLAQKQSALGGFTDALGKTGALSRLGGDIAKIFGIKPRVGTAGYNGGMLPLGTSTSVAGTGASFSTPDDRDFWGDVA